jgi:hypothetical protein
MKKKILIVFFMIFLIQTSYILTKEEIKIEELKFVRTLPAEGEDVFFKNIPFIAVDDFGNIYAVDNLRHTIYKLDKNGKLIMEIGRKGQGPGDLSYPRYISIYNNRIFTVDNIGISIFDLNGKFINRFRKFYRIFSIAVYKNTVLLASVSTKNLITVFDYKGKKLNSFGKKYDVDYSIHKGWPEIVVDRAINIGKIVCSENYIYYITYLFGDIFKYDVNGKLLFKKEMPNNINIIKRNRKIYFKKGVKKDTPYIKFLNDAIYFGNKIYLLLWKKDIYGEIWQLDENTLEVEKKYRFFGKNRENKIIARSIARWNKNNEQLFYISYRDTDIGDIFINLYKK